MSNSMDRYAQYDTVLLKPLEGLKSEELVGLARDILVLLDDDQWDDLLKRLPPEVIDRFVP